jgi:pyrroloquinoline quinone biosynthesis protein D
MTDTPERARSMVGAASMPRLPRHVKMRHDRARDVWTILAPERVYTPNAIAVAVLQLCDGARSVESIADELARTYDADKGEILEDVVPMLQDLADKGVVET